MFDIYREYWKWDDKKPFRRTKKRHDHKRMFGSTWTSENVPCGRKSKPSTKHSFESVIFYSPDPESSDDDDPVMEGNMWSSDADDISVASGTVTQEASIGRARSSSVYGEVEFAAIAPISPSCNDDSKDVAVVNMVPRQPAGASGANMSPPASGTAGSSRKKFSQANFFYDAYDAADPVPVAEPVTGGWCSGPCGAGVRRALSFAERDALKQGLSDAERMSRFWLKERDCQENAEEAKLAHDEINRKLEVVYECAEPGGAPVARCLVAGRLKILVLGDENVGKTALVKRFCCLHKGEALKTKDTVPTTGVDFKARNVSVKGNKLVKVQVWDTAGEQKYHGVTQAYYPSAHGIIIVYDASEDTSLANVPYWLQMVQQHAGSQAFVLLVANKTDLVQLHQMQEKENINSHSNVQFRREAKSRDNRWCLQAGRALAKDYSVKLFETSAKTGHNVEDAFNFLTKKIYDQRYTSSGLLKATNERSKSISFKYRSRKSNKIHDFSNLASSDKCTIT